ncbi:MAG: hypothetical protein QE487_00445 [Fluviicola sp.]|nr:hypothetical protein [Fluviicola sp.]
MRTILLVFFLSSISLHVSGFCTSRGISVFPSGKTIRPNTIFVVEGYSLSQGVIEKLGTTYPVYLINGKTKIRLTVKETLKGGYLLTQAVLIPERPPKKGVRYTFVIENLPKEEEKLTVWDENLGKDVAIAFDVIGNNDLIKPIFTAVPQEIDKKNVMYGCGPEVWVRFSCLVNDSSEVLIKATVKSLTTNDSASYYLDHGDSSLFIGHSMCSGAFLLNQGDLYQVTFMLIDASGNTTEWVGAPILFTQPAFTNPKPIVSIGIE